jgi:aminopeptidase N
MLSDYVGEARFLQGVSIYLKNHLYGNTVTTDLWEGIREATGNYTIAQIGLITQHVLRHRCR